MSRREKDAKDAGPFRTQPNEESMRGFDWLAYMRTRHPVAYDKQSRLWQVFRYDDVYRVITDYQTFSSEGVPNFATDIFLRETVVARDPPAHRRLRNLINQAFTQHAIARLTDTITSITQALLDKVRSQGKIDVVSDLAFPLTTRVIAVLLGVPDQDWDALCRWAKGPYSDSQPKTAQEAIQARNLMGRQMYNYFSQSLAQHRGQSCEDFLTALIAAESHGEHLSEDELAKGCQLLLVAGQKTTENLLTNALYCLTKYPESRDQLIHHPELITSTVEEVLRYFPPFWITVRRTIVKTELAGQRIPANKIIEAWNASANRDQAYFSDPERFDVQREPNHHLSFGHGIHFCLGAPLARLEAHIVIPMVLNQLKNLRRIPNVPAVIDPGPVHTIYALPVMFEV